MQVTQVQVGNVLYPLVEGQPLPVGVGDTIKVFYTFKYKIPQATDVKIWASLCYYTFLGFFEREEKAQTKETITLEAALEWKDYSSTIDVTISEGSAGIYGLILELPDYDVEDKIEACIEVTTAPGILDTITSIMPLIVIMLLFMLITPMMQGMSEGGAS